jgi:hypothetical protein
MDVPTDRGDPVSATMHPTTIVRVRERSRRRRVVAAIAAAASAFAVVGASATTLGGITGTDLGADTAVIGSCDTNGVTLAYTNTYDASLGRYQTTSVGVSGINAACAGKTLSLTLKDNTNASLASGTVASITGTSETVTMSGSGANANAVVGAAVVISG